MELYETHSHLDERLQAKADAQKLPLGGAIELTPLCNMSCKMCYVHLSKEEMEARGHMLSCEEWLAIARQAREQGVLFLLLTGGEPLLYPDFKRLYTELTDMGFVISLNTNGTLIDEAWADFFASRPCRRINITLYGKDDATYASLCGYPQGFSRVLRAAELLKERNIPFRLTCSVTPQNVQDQAELVALAKKLEVPYQPATYMFPGMRRIWDSPDDSRLTPEEAAETAIALKRLARSPEAFLQFVHSSLMNLLLPPDNYADFGGFNCHAGRSGFWLNWKGELLPCGMLEGPAYPAAALGFAECWSRLVESAAKMVFPPKCSACRLQHICMLCPASAKAESGSFDGEQHYLCRYTQTLARLLIDCLPEGERPVFEAILREELERNPIQIPRKQTEYLADDEKSDSHINKKG